MMYIGAEKIIMLAMLLLGSGGAVLFLINNFKLKTSIGLFISFAVSALTLVAVLDVFYGVPSDGVILLLPKFNFLKFRVHVDGVSAIFLFLLAVIFPFIFQFSAAYIKDKTGMRNFYPLAFLLTLSVYGLLVVADTLIILGIFWQLMAFCGWRLIKNGENLRRENAAKTFFVWMQIGFFFVISGALLFSTISDISKFSYFELFDFNLMSERIKDGFAANPLIANLAIAMFLIGFGIKIGIVPFGLFWLADSYDSAPTPITALFSAIVSKTGLYGLVRTFINLLPDTPIDGFNYHIWGIILAGLGATTLVIGTWRALIENEIKRILAFSSMATAGLVLIGLGVCTSLATISEKSTTVAAIAVIGVFVHFINHGIVNTVLFLNAGVVLNFARSRSICNVSGLARVLPISCVCGLISSLAAAGLPLLNGFIGKWFIYTTAIKCATGVPVFAVISGVAILAGILTVVVFIKYFGSVYLSKPAVKSVNSNENFHGKTAECEFNSYFPQVGLCFIAVIFSLFPQMVTTSVIKLLVKNPHGLGKLIAKCIHKFPDYDMGIHWGMSHAPAGVFATLAFAYSVATILSRCGNPKRRAGEAWLCGYQQHNRYTQYPPSHLCHEIINNVNRRISLRFDEYREGPVLNPTEQTSEESETSRTAGKKIVKNNDC